MTEYLAYELVHIDGSVQLGPRSGLPPEASGDLVHAGPLGALGNPLLANALATLECETVAEYPAGDHWIVVGRVKDARLAPAHEPLVFFAGAFSTVSRR